MKQGISGLTLRDIQAYYKPIVELTPRKVDHWIKNLPIANLGESSRAIYQLLVDMNQSLVDPDKKLSILQSINKTANHLIASLESQFLNHHIALNEKQRKIAALVQAIETEMSLCCHSIIESILSDEVKWSNKKVFAQSIALAIKYHGTVMLRCYQLYASVPVRIWRENYILYQVAKEHNLLDTEVPQSLNSNESISHYFIKMLLLSIATPYQLRQGEITSLWKMLSELAPYANFSSHAYNNHHYIVALSSSTPPIHKSLFEGNISQQHKLTLTPVVEYLKQSLTLDKNPNTKLARESMLKKHLIQVWSQGTHRAFARTPANEDLNISIGLGATHFLLMQEPGATDDDRSGATDTLEAMEGSLKHVELLDVAQREDLNLKSNYNYLSSTQTNNDVWAKLYRPDQAVSQPEENNIKQRSRDAIVKENYQLQSADLINMSPGGYCIQVSTDKLPKHAQTGEILGFLEENTWSIGVVRWVRRHAKSGVVQMGIQLLAPDVLPINVQLRNSKSQHNNEYQRALLLPELTGIGQPQTLITNSISYATNNKIRIVDRGEEYDAILSKEISATGSFKQFQFEAIGQKRETSKKSNNTKDLDSGIDGVWDIL